MADSIHPERAVAAPYTDVKGAAAYLGVSEREVRRRLQTGELRGHKVGTSWTVFLDAAEPSAMPPAIRHPEGTRPALDLGPLAALIERQQSENARLLVELERAKAEVAKLRSAITENTTEDSKANAAPPWYRRWRWAK